MGNGAMIDRERDLDHLLAAILMARHSPLSSHHAAALREHLGHRSDRELIEMIRGTKTLIKER